MRFLADESCDFAVVRALRNAGFDVLAVSEISPRAEDPKVIDLALKGQRILLTEDKDFGQLVYAHGLKNCGVILVRYPSFARTQLSKEVVQLVKQQGKNLVGHFVVVQPGRTRISQTP